MTFLLELKERIRQIYIKGADWILPILKFALAMLVFTSINNTIGFLPIFTNIFVLLIMALICALLSPRMIVVFGGIMIMGHCYVLGIEVAATVAIILVLLYIFAARYVEQDALAFVLTPLAFGVGCSCVIPVCYGLKKRPSSAVSVSCGAFIYYLIQLIKEKAPVFQGAEEADLVANVRLLLDGIVKNKMMLLSIAALALVCIVVYAIRKLSMDYAWLAAVFAGACCYFGIMVGGGVFLELGVSMPKLIIGTISALAAGIILTYFVLSVDYTRTERLEYEDDEYFYYVKAVPKLTIAQKDHTRIPIVVEADKSMFGDNCESAEYDQDDLERKLEESLKEL